MNKPVESVLRTSDDKKKGKDKKKKKDKGRNGLECWHCKKSGHIRIKCQSWLKDTAEGREYAAEHPELEKAKTGPLPTSGAKGNLSPDRAQVVAEPHGDTCWEVFETPRSRTDWILDSGATRHMTLDRTAFTEYSTVENWPVEMANGAIMPGAGLGKVRLAVKVRGYTRSVVLTDVLHVPQIKGNLISVTKLQDKGMVVETTVPPLRKAMIIKDRGRQVGRASRVGNSFVLDRPTDAAFPVQEPTDRNGRGLKALEAEYVRWHQRFGHIGLQIVRHVHTVVNDLERAVEPVKDQPSCEVCALTKKVRVVNRVSPERSTQPLARVFSDFWGPYNVPAVTKEKYMLTFTDDYTRKSWVYLTIDRASLPSVFARWRALVERQSGHRLMAVRSDNASEYVTLGGTDLARHGIVHERTVVYTPEQNGPSERLNRSLTTMARSMLLAAKLPPRFWGFAVQVACYLRNRMAIGPEGKSPEEAFTGRKPSVRHLRTFGCIAYADIPSVHRDKLDPTSRKTILVGYLPTSKQYQLYDPVTRSVIVSLNPRFEEDQFWDWSSEPEEPGEDLEVFDLMKPITLEADELLRSSHGRDDDPQAENVSSGGSEPQGQACEGREDYEDTIVVNTGQQQEADADISVEQEATDGLRIQGAVTDVRTDEQPPAERHDGPQRGQEGQSRETPPPERRSGRERRPKRHFDELRTATDRPAIPLTYEEAVNDKVYGQYWKDAIEEEIIKLQSLGTWEIAGLPSGKRTVGSKWVFNVKYTPTGLIDRFKARLVAQGFSQIPGADFEETFSSTVRLESLRTLLAVGAALDYEIHQTDIVSVYPRSILHAEVYMKAPQGVTVPRGKCVRIRKSLYGLKQSGREWYLEAAKGLAELGLGPTFADTCVFVNEDKSLIVGLYVDDMLIFASDLTVVREFKEAIARKWEIKDLGDVKKILGLEVTRDRPGRSIRIAQSGFTDELLMEYELTDARPANTPVGSPESLEPVAVNEELADVDRYQRVIGQLLYLMRGSRPDICFAVNRLSRYVAKPAVRHWKCVLQVLRYLKGTRNFGTTYAGPGAGQRLSGYVDSDYAGDRTDRRSIYGSVFMLFGGPVAWTSRKQASVSTSTTEAEYVALCQGNKEAMWLRELLRQTGFTQFLGDSLEVQMYSDNQGCMTLAENPEGHSRSKYIDVQYHYSR